MSSTDSSPADAGRATRIAFAAAFIAAAIAFAAAAATASPELGSFGGDSAEYALLAKAVREGTGYRTTWTPPPFPLHTLYPPGLPLLILPFVGDAPRSFLAAHLVLALAGAAAVFLFTRILTRRGFHPVTAAAAALAPALVGSWLRASADLLAELPFAAWTAGAVLLLETDDDAPMPPRRVAGAAACAAMAFLTRTAGIAVVGAVAWRLLRPPAGGRRGVVAVAALAAVCGAWFLYGRVAASGHETYFGVLASGSGLGDVPLPKRFFDNLTDLYLPVLPQFLCPFPGTVQDVAVWLLWILAGIGVVAETVRRRAIGTAALVAGAYLLLMAVWTFRDVRFCVPLAPFLALYVLEGVRAAASRLSATAARCVTIAVACVLLTCTAIRCVTRTLPRAHRATPPIAGLPPDAVRHDVAGFTESWGWDDAEFAAHAAPIHEYLVVCDAIRADRALPPGPVLSSTPRVTALFCGRPSVAAPDGADPAAVGRLVREKGIALILVDNFAGGEADAIRRFRAAPDAGIKLIYRLGGVEVLGVEPR